MTYWKINRCCSWSVVLWVVYSTQNCNAGRWAMIQTARRTAGTVPVAFWSRYVTTVWCSSHPAASQATDCLGLVRYKRRWVRTHGRVRYRTKQGNVQTVALTLCSPVVTICTASLTFNNSTFCPHGVFMCFVWISEQTAIISLYNINWLVFITEI